MERRASPPVGREASTSRVGTAASVVRHPGVSDRSRRGICKKKSASWKECLEVIPGIGCGFVHI